MNIASKFKSVIKNPLSLITYIESKYKIKFIPDKRYVQIQYYKEIGQKLDLDNPTTFNEKIQWLKLYDRDSKYTRLVDKYAVREYIAEKLGEEYLIPLIGVYNNFDDINFEELPNQFVLKCNHDSGGIAICKDKSIFNKEEARKILNKSLKRNYYYTCREWPYKNIKPKIICEKYMVDESGIELKDYKFMCFNGIPKCLFVVSNRHLNSGMNIDFYDMNWNIMPFKRRYPNSGNIIPKPKSFEKMVEFAKLLSENIPFVRVDFYDINGQLYFGEITFYPGSGYEEFTPEFYDELLGSWIKLPPKKG